MRKLIVFLALCSPAFGALATTVQWDVKTTGNNSNAGGFDASVVSPGTDESQGAGTAYTDIVATGSTASSVLQPFTSTTHGPGNTVVITGGSGCNTGTFEMLSQSGGVGTFDASLGTGTCTGTMGGSKATLCTTYSGSNCTVGAFSAAVNSNKIWVQTGTYAIGGTAQRNTNAAGTNLTITIIGYKTTHGDITPGVNATSRPLVTTATNTTNVFTVVGSLFTIENLSVSDTAGTPYSLVSTGAGTPIVLYNNKFDMSSAGASTLVYLDSAAGDIEGIISGNEFVGSTSSVCVGDGALNNGELIVEYNYFHGCGAGLGDRNVSNSQRWLVHYNAFDSNTRGVYCQAGGCKWIELLGNSFNNQTSENVYTTTSPLNMVSAVNNVFYGGTYGIRLGSTPTIQFSQTNFFGNIGTANYQNFIVGINPSDVSLSANPWTAPTSGNFTLNATSGGGKAVKAAGFPGGAPMGTGYIDGGALQSQGAAAAGGSFAYVQ